MVADDYETVGWGLDWQNKYYEEVKEQVADILDYLQKFYESQGYKIVFELVSQVTLGVEMYFLGIANTLKKYLGNDMMMHSYLPCANQEIGWSAHNKLVYKDLIQNSDKVTMNDIGDFSFFKVKESKYKMINLCDYLIVVTDSIASNEYIKYARGKHIPVYLMSPKMMETLIKYKREFSDILEDLVFMDDEEDYIKEVQEKISKQTKMLLDCDIDYDEDLELSLEDREIKYHNIAKKLANAKMKLIYSAHN